MKKYNIFKVVLITFLVLLLCSWIFPAAYYSGQFVDQGRVQMGLFDIFNYPITAVSYFGYIAIFLILVGGLYGVLYKIPAYRAFLDKLVDLMKGKEKIWISLMIVIIALLVSFCGLQIGIAIFIPFIVALILLMGYDKIVAAFVVVGSIGAGLIGTTFAVNNTSVLTQSLSLGFDYQIGVRLIILVVAIALVIFNTLMYIKRNVKNVKIEKKAEKKVEEKVVVEETSKPKKSSSSSNSSKKKTNSNKTSNKKSSSKSKNKAALKDEDVIVVKESEVKEGLYPKSTTGKHTLWPLVTALVLVFILITLAFISWGDSGFKVSVFDNATKGVTEFKLFGFALFGKLLGTVNAFGSWTITDMLLPSFLVVIILMIIYKVKVDDALEGFVEGAKKALGPALVVVMVYTILVLVTYHPFQLVIYKAILGIAGGFNIVTTMLVAILASLLNVDAAYAFQSVVPYYVSVVTKSADYPLVAVIFQTIYGLTMLVAPTSLVLMASLSYLKVSYKEWLKAIWKLLLELFVILLIIFIILALV